MTPCSRCGFTHNCICDAEPCLNNQDIWVLLTHPNELNKFTNTGALMQRSLAYCQRVVWSRTEPPTELISQLSDPTIQAWLLFPGDENHPSMPYQAPESGKRNLFIVIDATWQEARKMVRKSSWLQPLTRLQLEVTQSSSYQLRRNQQEGNLCTCEAGIALLEQTQHPQDAQALQHYFDRFMSVFQAERSGHKLTDN